MIFLGRSLRVGDPGGPVRVDQGPRGTEAPPQQDDAPPHRISGNLSRL